MKIGNTDYSFAYTVGVCCDREEMRINTMPKTKGLVELALLMNKAYNDREKFYNPDFKERILERDELLIQNAEVIPELDAELTEVIKRDSKINVSVSPIKKKEPGAESQ